MTTTPTASPELPDSGRRTHELKTDPAVFAAVLAGAKTHEIRLNDRGFQVGDELLLRETMATGADMRSLPRTYPLTYTGRTATRIVSHIQTGYGLADGWCILSFAGRAQPDGEASQAGCTVPPEGWYCTRAPGHDGPCAAWPIAQQAATPGARLVIGVAAPAGAIVSIMQPHADGTITAIYGGTHPAGDSMGRAVVAPAPSAPGIPEAPQPPFPVSDEEMAALRRFWECASDGEGYDVEKTMMQRLAEMGLVQRKSGAYYMVTEFGLYVLREYTIPRAAQLDGGQEGSAT